MKTTPYADYPHSKIASSLKNIPFFEDLLIDNPEQQKLLFDNASIMELGGGDVLIQKGQTDRAFYFLLKGELAVYPTEKLSSFFKKAEPIGHLSEGQLFGALAMMTGNPRNATIAAEKGSSAVVFACDCTIFFALEDFSIVTLATKLTLFRMVSNSIRFRLESYKGRDPNHPLAQEYAQIPKFTGDKDSVDELRYLSEQVEKYASLLERWNAIL
jgi:signal-transduction protein with cAMP-binding, CBS, and nucleotidyltransferase domain